MAVKSGAKWPSPFCAAHFADDLHGLPIAFPNGRPVSPRTWGPQSPCFAPDLSRSLLKFGAVCPAWLAFSATGSVQIEHESWTRPDLETAACLEGSTGTCCTCQRLAITASDLDFESRATINRKLGAWCDPACPPFSTTGRFSIFGGATTIELCLTFAPGMYAASLPKCRPVKPFTSAPCAQPGPASNVKAAWRRSTPGDRRVPRIKCLQALTLTPAMVHTVRSQGPTNPDQSIRPRARIHSGGSGRFTPTAVRLAPPDRPNWGPAFWTLEALQWQPTWSPRTHAVCPSLGDSTRGELDWGHKAAHDARRTLHHPEAMTCVRPPLLSFNHSLSNPCWPPPPSTVRSRASLDQPYRAWTCVLLSCSPVRRRHSADLVTVHLGLCFWYMLSRSLVFLSSLQAFPSLQHPIPESIISVHTLCPPPSQPLPLNEQHQLPGHPHVAFTS
ncbi:hypothetical protein F5883DRAFT_91985 [Diaporthe sp. PMI_573]|nr:hypothetical protein F5883DRAFT_91985 [Diaporthaceae sp. PMI_573]